MSFSNYRFFSLVISFLLPLRGASLPQGRARNGAGFQSLWPDNGLLFFSFLFGYVASPPGFCARAAGSIFLRGIVKVKISARCVTARDRCIMGLLISRTHWVPSGERSDSLF